MKMPHSVISEESVISAALADGRYFDELPWLTPAHFYIRKHGIIWGCMASMRSLQMEVDVRSVAAKLQELGKLVEVGGLYDIERIASTFVCGVEYHAQVLEKCRRSRLVMEMCDQALKGLGGGETEGSDTLILDLEQKLFALNESGKDDMENVTAKAMESLKDAIDKRKKGERVLGIKTGIGPWDKALGGLIKSRFYVIAARPGMGKTAMIEQIIEGMMLQDKSCLVFSQDMDADMLVSRMACRSAGICYKDYETGRCDAKALFKLDAAVQGLMTRIDKLIIYSPSSLTASAMRAIVRKEKRMNRVEAVFLDHVQCLEVGTAKDDIRLSLTLQSREIARSVKDTGIPHVVLAQLNREGCKGRPSPTNIKEFDALHADCDAMVLLWSEDDPSDIEPGKCLRVKFTMGKNRYGPRFEDELDFYGPMMRFQSPDFTSQS